MKEWIRKVTRPCGKWTDNVVAAAILSMAVMILGVYISVWVLEPLDFTAKMSSWLKSESMGQFITDYVQFIGIWAAVLLVVLIPRYNRPMMKAFTYNRTGNNIKGILAGLALGFGTNALCILISVLTGHIKLSFFGFQPKILIAFLVAVLIQSGAEEMLDRFYLYQKLRRRYRNPYFAMCANAIVFMLMHVANPGFTVVAGVQIFLVGFIFSLLIYYYNSLWAAMFFHTAWNYTQNIIFGLPNSGMVSEYSIFKLEAASATNGFFYNVNFGVEGSIGACLVLAAVGAAIIFINRGKPEKTDVWADEEYNASGGKHAAKK